ncbi:uncharacterized protein LOC124931451 [Impatiens glandulifera]|uniref:uncharacterized protein LOC124931451 n=1 Tax=Impatiens glandulifera TaxID=253017 RepID=UPI001FB16FE3|nr:uncharacterized protein LOC124931451 [Impatiens glandulifera]
MNTSTFHRVSMMQRSSSSTPFMNTRTTHPTPFPKDNNDDWKKTHFSTPTFEFPASPQSAMEENERMFRFHPNHPLTSMTMPELFTCSGCKEYGAGKRFVCHECDFQLHEFCALSPMSLKNHPLHGQHQLLFHTKPKSGGILWPKCEICGKATRGFTFKCTACNFQMHPSCALLSTEMKLPNHAHTLRLMPITLTPLAGLHGDNNHHITTNVSNGGSMCVECYKKRSGRIFSCTVCENHNVHAVCAKDMFNGLRENGIKRSPERPSMLAAAARVASIVIVEFIGGLIDGIGEGVGEALAQNIAPTGRSIKKRRSPRGN